MATPSAPLPRADLIRHIRNATITRAMIQRKARHRLGAVYDADGALDGLGCPRPGLLGRMLGWLDR